MSPSDSALDAAAEAAAVPAGAFLRMVATCPEETKPALVDELQSLGVQDLRPVFRAVEFTVEPALYYELHLRLRTASRLLRIIRTVPAQNGPMLYSQVRRLHWPEWFDARHGFMVECLGADAKAGGGLGPKQVITQVREGIRASFAAAGAGAPKVDTEEPKVVVVAHVVRGRCTLSFDTTGKSLHKRGYRESGHPAPLKETLAAAILRFAGYDGTQPFLDPMCGSGTLAIEAAMVAVDKAPQIHRRKGEFNFEWLKDFDRPLWRATQDRVRLAKLEAPRAPVVASDIEPKYVEMARKGALKARVERYIQFASARVQDVEPPGEQGLLVTNLPYGERIGGATTDVAQLYGEVGDVLKQRFGGWRAAILAAEASPYKAIGLKPSRSISLMNGSIPCRLLLFELYAGSRRRPRTAPPAGSPATE
jgi:putative N6-adenine-specific DNA methylase